MAGSKILAMEVRIAELEGKMRRVTSPVHDKISEIAIFRSIRCSNGCTDGSPTRRTAVPVTATLPDPATPPHTLPIIPRYGTICR